MTDLNTYQSVKRFRAVADDCLKRRNTAADYEERGYWQRLFETAVIDYNIIRGKFRKRAKKRLKARLRRHAHT